MLPKRSVRRRMRPSISLSVLNAVATCRRLNKGDIIGIVTLKATANAAKDNSGEPERAKAALMIGRAKGKKTPLSARGINRRMSSR